METCVREGLQLSQGTRATGIASARICQIGPLGGLTLLWHRLIRGFARHDGTVRAEMYAAVDLSQSKPWSLREELAAQFTSVQGEVRRLSLDHLAASGGRVIETVLTAEQERCLQPAITVMAMPEARRPDCETPVYLPHVAG